MFAQKFETKILSDGTIKLPRLTVFKKDTAVEVIILEKTGKRKPKTAPGNKLTPIAFYNKWVGILQKGDDDYWQYVENKHQ